MVKKNGSKNAMMIQKHQIGLPQIPKNVQNAMLQSKRMVDAIT